MAHHPFHHLGLKALSVGLAALLWLSVTRDAIVERSLRVPLEYQNIPETLEIVGEPPGTVDVRVRGASSILSRLEPGDVVAVLDLRGARPGERLFHLLTDEVRVPFGIEVAQVAPPTLSLAFERSGAKVVPVVPTIQGEPAPGFVGGKVQVDPPTVEVVGPASHIAQLHQATTEPVSIENARANITDRVTIGVENAALRLRLPQTAVVTIEVRPASIDRRVELVEVRPRNLPPRRSATIVPSGVAVVVRGSREAIAEMPASAVEVYVDLTELGPGRYTVPVRAEPGGQFSIVRIDPESVLVRIR
jgi:YbbR domain-containing protein